MAIPDGAIKIITSKNNTFFSSNKISIGTAAPTSGTYNAGDLVVSSSANSIAFAWVCTVSGAPGTWKTLKSGTDVTSLAWGNITGKPSTYAPTLGTTSTTAFRGDYGNTSYTHSQSAHAPYNAQKNSDITKAEIEAKLTGDISSHNHDSRYYTETEVNGLLDDKADSTHTHNYAGSSSAGGAATSATKLSTARKISLTGNLSGSTTFDGSGDVSISVTIPTSANGDFFGGYAKVNVDGVMEIGKHVDFHNADDSTDDYNTRITCTNTGTANVINLPTQNGTIALTSDISSAIGNINTLLDEINGVSL